MPILQMEKLRHKERLIKLPKIIDLEDTKLGSESSKSGSLMHALMPLLFILSTIKTDGHNKEFFGPQIPM